MLLTPHEAAHGVTQRDIGRSACSNAGCDRNPARDPCPARAVLGRARQRSLPAMSAPAAARASEAAAGAGASAADPGVAVGEALAGSAAQAPELSWAPVAQRLERNAGCLAAGSLCPHVIPAYHAQMYPPEQALSALLALDRDADRVSGLRNRGGRTGSRAPEALADDQLVEDTGRPNTFSDKSGAGQVPEPSCGSTCPSRPCDFPSHGPSDHPNEAPPQLSIDGSTREAGGSSAQGLAEQIAARRRCSWPTKVRRTTHSSTSYRPGTPNTSRRRRSSSRPIEARSKPGTPVRPGAPEDRSA